MRSQNLLFTCSLCLKLIVIVETHSSDSFTCGKALIYVPENLHPTIKWSAQQPYPLKAEMQDNQWQIVDQNEKLNSNLKTSINKTSNPFVTAKGSMPLKYKIVEHTSTKYKADNQGESKS